MAAPKGHPRYGGRTKGTRNRRTQELQDEIAKSGLLNPVDYLLAIMRNEKLDLSIRLDAAKAVAPYTNPRLAVIDSMVRTEVNVTAVTDEQRRERARQAILEAFAERQPLKLMASYKVIAGNDNRDELPARAEQWPSLANNSSMRSSTGDALQDMSSAMGSSGWEVNAAILSSAAADRIRNGRHALTTRRSAR